MNYILELPKLIVWIGISLIIYLPLALVISLIYLGPIALVALLIVRILHIHISRSQYIRIFKITAVVVGIIAIIGFILLFAHGTFAPKFGGRIKA